MAILYQSLLNRMRNNLARGSWNIYGEGRNVDVFLQELERLPPEGFIILCQDLGLCSSVDELVKDLKWLLEKKFERSYSEPANVKGLSLIFDYLHEEGKRIIWILNQMDEVFQKSRAKSFNRDFFNSLNAISRKANIKLLLISKKPLKAVDYWDIDDEGKPIRKPSPIDFPVEEVGRINRQEAEALVRELAAESKRLEKIVEVVFSFKEFEEDGYLPSQLEQLYTSISRIIDSKDDLSKKDRQRISRKVKKLTSPPLLIRLARTKATFYHSCKLLGLKKGTLKWLIESIRSIRSLWGK